jgi:hypothetical protein
MTQRITTEHGASCAGGSACADVRPGHDMHAIQRRLAAATPSKWRDVIVTSVREDGWVTVSDFATGEPTRVWHHESLAGQAETGEPAALSSYNVLAVGDAWFNVAPSGE